MFLAENSRGWQKMAPARKLARQPPPFSWNRFVLSRRLPLWQRFSVKLRSGTRIRDPGSTLLWLYSQASRPVLKIGTLIFTVGSYTKNNVIKHKISSSTRNTFIAKPREAQCNRAAIWINWNKQESERPKRGNEKFPRPGVKNRTSIV